MAQSRGEPEMTKDGLVEKNQAIDTVGAVQTHSGEIGGALSGFLHHCRIVKQLSSHTIRAYSCDLADFVSVAAISSFVAVTKGTIREYTRVLVEDRHLRAATVRRRLACVRVFFRWLEREKLISVNVFRDLEVSIRMPRALPRALESEETGALVQHSAKRVQNATKAERHGAFLMHFVITTLITTGLRIGELVNLTMQDVSSCETTIRVKGKGSRERFVFISGKPGGSVFKGFLRERRKTASVGDFILTSPRGGQLNPQLVRERLRKLADAAGISRRVTPHMLRHTAATQLLEAGVDIRYVQRLLGHTSIATTQIYAEVRDLSLKAVLQKANILSRYLT